MKFSIFILFFLSSIFSFNCYGSKSCNLFLVHQDFSFEGIYLMQEQAGYGQGYPFSSYQEHRIAAEEAWSIFIKEYINSSNTHVSIRNLRIFLEIYLNISEPDEVALNFGLSEKTVRSIAKNFLNVLRLFVRNPLHKSSFHQNKAYRELAKFLRFERGIDPYIYLYYMNSVIPDSFL